MNYILGVDQGIKHTGWCIMDINKTIIDRGYIKNDKAVKDAHVNFKNIYKELLDVLSNYDFNAIVCEALISTGRGMDTIHSNLITGFLFSYALEKNIEFVQYYPVTVKKTVTGSAKAAKDAVINTINTKYSLNLKISHEADAIAIALTHVIKGGVVDEGSEQAK